MWAVAAQPREGLTPMIPTPNLAGAVVTSASSSSNVRKRSPRSGDRGFAGRDGLHRQFDARRLADEDAPGLQGDIPGEPEVFAVDLGGRAEADALVAHRGGAAAVEVDLEGDGLGGAVHGQVPDDLPGLVAQRLHSRRREGDRRVVLDVEEVAALEVRVTVIVSRAHAGRVDLHLDMRVLRVLGNRDLTSDGAETAADLGDHEMA